MSAPLRVAFVFGSRGIGGAERSMLRLAARAHPRVFACRLIVPAPENRALRGAAAAVGVPYHGLSSWNAVGLYRLLRSERPDVLYVFGRIRTVPWVIAARLAGVRCVVAAERSAANRWSDRWARRLDRLFVTAYLANSEFGARNLRAIVGPGGPPVWIAPSGVEDQVLGQPVRPSSEPPTLLCVGNITANKGQGVLLEAVRLLRPRYPGLRATLVGRDFTKGRFFVHAHARGLVDTYEALGFQDDVRPHLARSRVVVLPTLHREGVPASLLEAMRAGVPVVATRVGGVGEVVEDGRTGLLVTPGDARGLADAIGRLLEDEVLAQRLAANARRLAAERHSISVVLEGHRTAFRDALARANARAAGSPVAASVAHVTTADVSLRYLLLDQLRSIRQAGYAVSGISSPGPDVAALEAMEIPHEPVAMTRRLTPLADLVSLVRLYLVMRRRRFTIVHTHTPKPGLLGQVAARLAGVPIVVNTLHGFYFHDRMRPWARRFFITLEKIAALCSDVVLSQNEEDVMTAIRKGIVKPERIRHLGNGIDVTRFDPGRLEAGTRHQTRTSLGIPDGVLVVGFVGRLVREKGVGELLLAARVVLERVPDTRFLLVGGTDTEKPDHLTPAAARELGVDGACIFAGVRQDMPELYGAMDVLVLPSHREGFPRAPMEASAMKVPCVVTNVRGCRQVVTQGQNGLLVPVGDTATLAKAILRLLTDPLLRHRMGEEGRRRALLEFDERRVFARVLVEYERLLAAKGLRHLVPRGPREQEAPPRAASR